MLMDDCSRPADPLREKKTRWPVACRKASSPVFFIDIVYKDW
jgi:hypothetical protein